MERDALTVVLIPSYMFESPEKVFLNINVQLLTEITKSRSGT